MTSMTRTRTAGRALGVIALLVIMIAGQSVAQRIGDSKRIVLSPPSVKVFATPLTVTVAWRPVDGAASYMVERASTPNGPWSSMPLDPRAGTQVTAPTFGGNSTLAGGFLHYYRVTALPPLGPRGEPSLSSPAGTVVPRVTPPLGSPVGVGTREEGADLWVSWEPVPYASGYLVTAASGPQLTPTHTVEVAAQYTEARLVNVASPNMARTVWVAVTARYGPALSSAVPIQFTIPAVQQCWPPGSIPMSPPTVLVASSPTSVSIGTGGAVGGNATARVERAPMGSQAWQIIGCKAGPVLDASLTPGTQYQYRVTEVWPSGQVGQAIVVGATSVAPDNQSPTATVSGCTAAGCLVTLNWIDYAGTLGVRIESSYGLSQVHATKWLGKGWNGPTIGTGPNAVKVQPSFSVPLPKGGYTFSLTTLFPPMRPSSKPPGQVTVVVP
jgi:hypothetical protein